MFNKKKNGKKAFTLVELLVVIAILAILATVSTVGYLGFIENARRSKDIQLVSNINHVLAAEQAYTDSPVAAVEIVENLEEKGFELKTESKNAYLFYNTNTNRVELGDFDKNGYKKVYPEDDSKSSTYGVETFGTIDDLIYAPESFIDGYLLIGKSSRDGFADAINTIRNPKSYSDITKALETINGFSKANDMNDTGVSVYSTLSTLVNNASFVGANNEGNSEFIDENTQPKRYAIFSQNVVNLNKTTVDKISSRKIRIVDIPSNVKTIDDNAYDSLKKLVDNSTVISSQEFIDMLNAKGWKEISSNIVVNTDRKNAVKEVVFVSYVNGSEAKTTVVEYTKESVEISAYDMFVPSSDTKIANKFVGWKYNPSDDYISIEKKVTLDGLPTSIYYHTIDAGDEFLTDENGRLKIYVMFENVTPNVKIGDKYFDINDAIEYANNGIEEELYVLGKDGVINRDVVLESKDILRVPMIDNDTIKYDNVKEPFTQDAAWYTRDNNPLNMYSNLNIDAKLYVDGNVFVGGYHYAGNSTEKSSQLVGNYGQLTLNSKGLLTIRSGSKLVNYGVISSNDDVQRLIIGSGATLYGMMVTDSFNGGTYSKELTNNVFQFGTYYMDGLFVKTLFKYNSIFKAQLLIHVNSAKIKAAMIANVIAPNNDSNQYEAIFKMNSGNEITYYHNKSTNRTLLEITKGTSIVDKLYMGINISCPPTEIAANTSKVEMPISGLYDVVVKNGAQLDITTNDEGDPTGVKMMPGSSLTVEDGGILKLDNSGLVAYQWAENNTQKPSKNDTIYGYNQYFDSQGNSLTFNKYQQDALIKIDGKLVISGKCGFNGKILSSKQMSEVIFVDGEVNWKKTTKESVYNVGYFEVYATRDGNSYFNETILN
ncbi:MAG: type II secretion system protein [Bacilli bacterium]|nr:type II secretion system protein [Bacilli bacterium]